MNYDGYEAGRGWSEGASGSFTGERASYFEAELRAIGLVDVRNLRVLEIGFGNGSFLGWCRSQGWQCEGLEVNARLLERATASDYLCAADLKALGARGGTAIYDLVTGFDVLEHMDRTSSVRLMADLSTVGSPKTLLLFRFPNGGNPFFMSLQNGDVAYLTAIGQFMVCQVATLVGFDVLQLRGPSLPRSRAPLHRRFLQSLLQFVRSIVGRSLRYLFMGGLPVVFTPNLVAVLRHLAMPAPSSKVQPVSS